MLSRQRNLDLGIAARGGYVNCGDYRWKVQAHERPRRVTENHDGDSASEEILLIAKILIGGEKDIKPCHFRRCDQFAIF